MSRWSALFILAYLVFMALVLCFLAVLIDEGTSRNQTRWDETTGLESPRPSGTD